MIHASKARRMAQDANLNKEQKSVQRAWDTIETAATDGVMSCVVCFPTSNAANEFISAAQNLGYNVRKENGRVTVNWRNA